jgi:hypothetical protein
MTDILIFIIPVGIIVAGFFASEAGKTILVAFRTSLPKGWGIGAIVMVIVAFVFTAAFYYVMIIGLLIWAMSLMGGIGNSGSNSSNSNNWRNTGDGE